MPMCENHQVGETFHNPDELLAYVHKEAPRLEKKHLCSLENTYFQPKVSANSQPSLRPQMRPSHAQHCIMFLKAELVYGLVAEIGWILAHEAGF